MEIFEYDNPRYPHHVRIIRSVAGCSDTDDPYSDAPVMDGYDDILYDGEGRVFTDTTTEGNNRVDENKRKASIPVRYDEWDTGRKPLDGDMVYATIGDNTEVGMVKDCESDNNRTLVYWDYTRV